jgi:MFS family permease
VAAITVGNALEFYDFLTYAYFAGQIGRTFFPSAVPNSSLLASLALFGLGFATRPVGAWVIGRLGDRRGRKPAMLLSFTLMGASMIGLALIPSYRAIGVAAPLLAFACRLVQGFALGGEVGPTTAFLIEAAPPGRRGLYVSMQFLGQRISNVLSGLVGLALSSSLSEAAMDTWGWRAAFLAGGLIVPVGFALRRGLAETLPAAGSSAEAAPAAGVGVRRIAVLGGLILAAGTVVTYVLTYLTTFASSTLHLSTRVSFLPTVAGGVCGVIATPVGGWLADRFGRRPVMIIPTALLLLGMVPAFWLMASFPTGQSLMLAAALISVLSALAFAPVLTAVTEALPAKIRSGALALVYALAIATFGGTTQFLVAWLIHVTGSPLAPAWYATAALAAGLLAMMATPETAPDRETPRRRL